MVKPPKYAQKLLQWFIKDELAEEVFGDLDEKFYATAAQKTAALASRNYWYQVLNYLRPFAIKKYKSKLSALKRAQNLITMYKNYFKLHWRNLVNNKGFSFINISGLAVGMAVALMIGIWIQYEIGYDKYHPEYDRIAQVYQNQTFESDIETWQGQALQLAPALHEDYPNLFEHAVTSSYNNSYIFKVGDKVLNKRGIFIQDGGADILAIEMVEGSRDALKDYASILISESFAESFFDGESPIGKSVMMPNKKLLKVAGVYKNIKGNTKFDEIDYIGSWGFYDEMRNLEGRVGWGASWFRVFVKLKEDVNMESASLAIKDVKLRRAGEDDQRFKPEIFLHPMSKWHLYGEYKNGVNTGGKIDAIWLFGIIGSFVLVLACINFMNLSTARADKRAKEIGIRKSLGSLKSQLIGQYYSESLFITTLSYIAAILLTILALPYFENLFNTMLSIPWQSWEFWTASLAFIIFTSLLSGSYPALMLSSFSPVKSLKKESKAGKGALRRALVVFQFSISIILIIGTMVINQQIQHAKNRPLGYDTDGVVTTFLQSSDEIKNYEIFKNQVLDKNLASALTLSESTVTNTYINNSGFNWEGKPAGMQDTFVTNGVDYDFGKVVNWEIVQGRDFNKDLASDSMSIIVNQTAVSYLGFDEPLGKTLDAFGGKLTIIGVVKDLLNQGAYEPTKQTIYYYDFVGRSSVVSIKLNPKINISTALLEIEQVFKSINPESPFDYSFSSDRLKRKYQDEERMSSLAMIASIITIFISSLGIFAMAAFLAERKSKEISIRKILGASVSKIWVLLSKEFALLIVLAGIISTPIAFYLMQEWLADYNYRTTLPWWVFGLGILIAFTITVITISYQTIKAALVNPIDTLRSE
ncbi:MAG: ABC transporter permease [Bacteroidota bacterium]